MLKKLGFGKKDASSKPAEQSQPETRVVIQDEGKENGDWEAAVKAVGRIEDDDVVVSYSKASGQKSMRLGDVIKRAYHHGYLYKRGGSVKSWKKRYHALVGRTLYYYKNDNPNLEPIHFIKLDALDPYEMIYRCDDETEKKNSFKIVTSDRVLFCYTDSEENVMDWSEKLTTSYLKTITKNVMNAARLQGWITFKAHEDDSVWLDRYGSVYNGRLYVFPNDSLTNNVYERCYDLNAAVVKRRDYSNRPGCIHLIPADEQSNSRQSVAMPTTTPRTSRTGTIGKKESAFVREALRKESIIQKPRGGTVTAPLQPIIVPQQPAPSEENETTKPIIPSLKKEFFAGLANLAKNTPVKGHVFYSPFEDNEIWEKILLEEVANASISKQSQKAQMRGYLYLKDPTTALPKSLPPPMNMYYFTLSNNRLYFFEDDQALTHQGVLELDGRLVTRCDREVRHPFSFKIAGASSAVYLHAEGDDEADCWVEQLKVRKNLIKNLMFLRKLPKIRPSKLTNICLQRVVGSSSKEVPSKRSNVVSSCSRRINYTTLNIPPIPSTKVSCPCPVITYVI
jgi:hypothetical protein